MTNASWPVYEKLIKFVNLLWRWMDEGEQLWLDPKTVRLLRIKSDFVWMVSGYTTRWREQTTWRGGKFPWLQHSIDNCSCLSKPQILWAHLPRVLMVNLVASSIEARFFSPLSWRLNHLVNQSPVVIPN